MSDNAANMKKCWNIIQGRFPHVLAYGCAAHGANLLAQDLCKIAGIAVVIAICRQLVLFFKRKTPRILFVEEAGAEVSLSAPSDVRWSSNLHMVSSVSRHKGVIRRCLASGQLRDSSNRKLAKLSDSLNKKTSENSFWQRVDFVEKLLKPPADVISMAESDGCLISDLPHVVANAEIELIKLTCKIKVLAKPVQDILKVHKM